MATKLRPSTSATLLADVIFETHLGLASDPETQDLAGPWQAFLQKSDGLAVRFRETERAVRGVRTRLRLADTQHDNLLKRFNRALLDAADGNRKGTLYSQFFGAHSVSEITAFGIQREISESKRIVALLQAAQNTAPDSKLAELATRFAAPLATVVETMARLSSERAELLQKAALLQVEKSQAIEDFNRELNLLEGALLQKFPTDTARVGSYLKASQPIDSDTEADGSTDVPAPAVPAPAT